MIRKTRKSIPDLRPEHTEVTLEHCHVLLIKFADAIELMEGDKTFRTLADNCDPMHLMRFFKKTYEIQTFNRLFNSELGKGFLVGAFVQALQSGEIDLEPMDC